MQRRPLTEYLARIEESRDAALRFWAARSRWKLRWRALAVRSLLHIVPGETILEIGAGSGWWTEHLDEVLRSENPVTAAVFSGKFLDRTRAVRGASFVHVSDLASDLPAESFDYVVGSAMLLHEHFPEVLEAVFRLLKPGGEILFFELNPDNPARLFRKGHAGGAHADRIVHACSHQGFTHITVEPYDLVPSRLGDRFASWLQAKVVLLEHAPIARSFCDSIYLSARKPGLRIKPSPDLCDNPALFGTVSVVVPCHNEAPNIDALVKRLLAFYGRYIREIIIVNDNSSDDTAGVTQKLSQSEPRVRLLNREMPNGVGRALRDGYKAASGTYILSMDCDFIEILPEFRALFEAIGEGFDGAIGSRFSHESVLVNYPFSKMLYNRLCHALVKLFLVRDIRDITNNLKLYRADILKNLEIESPHFSANLETGLKPILAGHKIKEVPISWMDRTIGMGASKFQVQRVGPDYARTLYRIWKSRNALRSLPAPYRAIRARARRGMV